MRSGERQWRLESRDWRGGRGHGRVAPIAVPEACKTVWDEAEKDTCFSREAIRKILGQPLRWLALAPAKMAATFDYAGAPGYYLHASNPDAFSERAKLVLGAVETVYERLGYLGALLWAGTIGGPRRKARLLLTLFGALLLFQTHAYWAVLLLGMALALLGRVLLDGSTLAATTCATLLATALVHAVFFGAGRYGMVLFPLISALSTVGLAGVVRAMPRQTLTQSPVAGRDGAPRSHFDSRGRAQSYWCGLTGDDPDASDRDRRSGAPAGPGALPATSRSTTKKRSSRASRTTISSIRFRRRSRRGGRCTRAVSRRSSTSETSMIAPSSTF